MFGQTLIEVKMGSLKTHEFHPWRNFELCHVIGERMEVTPIIGIDPRSVCISDIHYFDPYLI